MSKIEKTETAKKAMTIDEQRCFLNFLPKSKRYKTYFPLNLYNQEETERAAKEKWEPFLLPCGAFSICPLPNFTQEKLQQFYFIINLHNRLI